MIEAYADAFAHLLTPLPMLALIAGVLLGVVSGAMPAGGLPVLIVLMGFAYHMDPYIAIPLAIGHMAAVPTTDAIPCILLGMPGSATAQATILDGYPMAKKGLAGEALAAAYFASLLGGLVGAIGLAASLPVARSLLKLFGAPEFFLLGIVGICVVGVVSSGALVKGLLAALFGLAISMVGFDEVVGMPRATFGIQYLWDGVPLIPAIIGLFALPELLDMVVSDTPIARERLDLMMGDVNKGRGAGIRAVLQHKWLVIRSSLIGVFVGMMPGVGGAVAHWLAYAQARQTEKDGTKTFGTGDVRGVIAPEAANNSIDGGVLIPTLAFSLPGSVGMALMLGFLVLLGLQPGPQMLNENLSMTLLIVLCLAISNILVTGLALCFTTQMAKIAVVRPNVLVPLVMVVLMLSAFQVTHSMGDLIMVVVFTAVGLFMKRYGWPRPPIIIALVLAGPLEKYLWLSVRTYGLEMFMRPQVWAIALFAVLAVMYTQRVQAGSKVVVGEEI